ncbi:hypothetical protein ACI797_11340 [Geodermatophilus sp. SYSU D00691]
MLFGTSACSEDQAAGVSGSSDPTSAEPDRPGAGEAATPSDPTSASNAGPAGIDWREATLANQAQVDGAQEWASGLLDLGYHEYGLPITGSVPDDLWVGYGIGFCQSVDEVGGDVQEALRTVAATTGSGLLLTPDFTVDMYEAQLQLATTTLCPEFDSWRTDSVYDSHQSVVAEFLSAWERQDVVGMTLMSTEPATSIIETAQDYPLIPPDGEVVCDPPDGQGLLRCYVATSVDERLVMAVEAGVTAGGRFLVMRLMAVPDV